MPGSMSSSMPETLVFSEMLFGFNPLDHAASDKMDLSVCVHFFDLWPSYIVGHRQPVSVGCSHRLSFGFLQCGVVMSARHISVLNTHP